MNRRKSILPVVATVIAVAASWALHKKNSEKILELMPLSAPRPAEPRDAHQSPQSLNTTVIAAVTPDQFASLLQQTFTELPTAASLGTLTEEEAHDTPEAITSAGAALGRIAQAVHDNPALAPAAAAFYSRCAYQGEVVMPIRALCYSHVMKNDTSSEPIPAEVVRLARMIPAD